MKPRLVITAVATAFILGAVVPFPHSAHARHRTTTRLGGKAVQNLPMPVLFGVNIFSLTPDFGDPRSGGREHEGQDILAPRGAPIISPTEAVVLDRGVWPGAGNYVSTANPGGENFRYMHLDQPSHLRPGDKLEAGDLIGFVGATGNASGGAPHLHFEIRKSGAIDPYPRLTGGQR
jgi:murein DD-endopeptidase MepM/ murein hydrolase activator NlpD